LVSSASTFADPIDAKSRNDDLLTGDEYRSSLRDGRRVIGPDGTEIDDITKHPQFAPAIDTFAEYYDALFDPRTADLLTHIDGETGRRSSVAWSVPRSLEDLERKREVNRYVTHQTMGVFGRPPDYSSGNALGLLSLAPELREMNPAWAANAEGYQRWGRDNCVIQADLGVDLQSDRNIPINERPGRLRAEERDGGLVIHGAKSCNSVCVQAHVGTVITHAPPTVSPDSIVFCMVPMNAPGLTMACREAVTGTTNSADHPVDRRGEEVDAFVFFDRVYVPPENVFAFGKPRMLELYQEFGAFCLWHILSRITYRAELIAGMAQLVTQALGTTVIPQVRDTVTEMIAYADTLKAFVIASESTAVERNGMLVPNPNFVTPGRLHSVTHYPRVLQQLRELSGQGIIARPTQAQWDREDIGTLLDAYAPGTGFSARAKSQLMNLVWDIACGSHASRVALFENVNATPAATMRAHIYGATYHKDWAQAVRRFLGGELAAGIE
jgi:4-hydroxyphenylacetate 3-monooxygenase